MRIMSVLLKIPHQFHNMRIRRYNSFRRFHINYSVYMYVLVSLSMRVSIVVLKYNVNIQITYNYSLTVECNVK